MSLADFPLAAFDLETTGPDPTECRIVTASIVEIVGSTTSTHEWLLDPEVEIPQGATDVHGISTEHAREHGTDYSTGVEAITEALARLWDDGYLVVVMNAPFDMTIIDREGRRLWGRHEYYPGALVDPLVIDKHLYQRRRGGGQFSKGARTLADLAIVYGVRQDDAHQSTGDCLTAARVAYKQLRRREMASIDDPDTLQQLQRSWRAAQQDSLRAYWQGRGDERWREVNGDWPVQR